MVPICLDVPLWFISCPGDERSRGRARLSVTQLNQESGELHHWTNIQQRHNFFFFFLPHDTSLYPRAPPLVFSPTS